MAVGGHPWGATHARHAGRGRGRGEEFERIFSGENCSSEISDGETDDRMIRSWLVMMVQTVELVLGAWNEGLMLMV